MSTKYLNVRNYIAHIRYLLSKRPKKSYAQNGEDLIINAAITETLHIDTPSYLDIGAYEPVFANNTYYFYRRGSRGVCVEPNPQLFRKILKERPLDVSLNVGVGPIAVDDAPYYILSSQYLNSFKKEDAELHVARGKQKIEAVAHMPLVTINSIIKEYFPHGVDILSLDVEGHDLAVLKSLDFANYAPRLICVETLRYNARGELEKVTDIGDLLLKKGYELFADTHVNSIFVQK